MSAKFRQNHTRDNPFSGLLIRVIAFAVVLIFGFMYLYQFLGDNISSEKRAESYELKTVPSSRTFLPSSSGEIIHHKYYSLSYSERHEQAEWVAYRLTEESLRIPNVPRHDRFMADYNVTTRTAFHRDYSGSGYTRGHLVPAGDMAFDSSAMRETFYMSNISPQLRSFNNGIWRELEEQTRDWAYHNDELIVISGPILQNVDKSIGKNNRVSVPKFFYKVILDYTGPSKNAIAFLIPHQSSKQHLREYSVPVDSIEVLTGIDFFNGFIDASLEQRLESKVNTKPWKFSKKRFELRVNRWNYQ